MKTSEIVIGAAFIVLIILGAISSVSGISVYEKGTNYVIWDISGESQIVVSGEVVNVTGNHYTMHDLHGGTSYSIEDINGTVYQTTTIDDIESIIRTKGLFILMFLLVILSYLFPISAILPAFIGIWSISDYLPSIGAGYLEYALIGVAITLSLMGATIKSYGR